MEWLYQVLGSINVTAPGLRLKRPVDVTSWDLKNSLPAEPAVVHSFKFHVVMSGLISTADEAFDRER